MNINIVAICGSLREESYNKSALKAAYNLLPEGVTLTEASIKKLPLYNQDLEGDLPNEVLEFKEVLSKADAVLLITPEYNYSYSGVLKNALDWASRGDAPLEGKPGGIISASMSDFGGLRAQYHLRQVCTGLDILLINDECFIPSAHTKFDEEGNLIDERTKNSISTLLQELTNYTKKLK